MMKEIEKINKKETQKTVLIAFAVVAVVGLGVLGYMHLTKDKDVADKDSKSKDEKKDA